MENARGSWLSLPLLGALCLAVLLATGTLAWAHEFEDAKRRYKERLGRDSLHKRLEGRFTLAATADERALDLLASSYKKVEEPKDRIRHLLVSMCLRYMSEPRYLPRYTEWREAQKARRDAWLWLETLRLSLWTEGPDAAARLASNTRDPWLRAACIESLATARHPVPHHHEQSRTSAPPTFLEAARLLDELPSDRLARMLQLEACSSAITAHDRSDVDEEEIRGPIDRLIGILEEPRLEDRTALTIARHLSAFFEVEEASRDPAVWRRHLATEGAADPGAADAAEGETVAFVGLRATGSRIVFVIDASDSMCTPVNQDARDRLKHTISAARRRPDVKAEPIVWEDVKTRFDVAREYLKAALRGLPDGHHFAVILFGDEARFLGDETKLQKASKRTIAKAVDALDSIYMRSANANAPHGVLRGETNLHGGLRRAFLVHARSSARQFEPNADGAAYVDPKLLHAGCDTIFLLSDGLPNDDDWKALDRSDPTDAAMRRGDSGIRTQRRGEMWYAGPYGSFPDFALVGDLRRMNLFRRVEIHCVALGEADTDLLKAICKIGNGRLVEL